MDSCGLGDWSFQRRSSGPARSGGRHLVVASVFRITHAYRDSSKYAAGLLRLCEAVRGHLPDFALRIYHDRSLLPECFAADIRRATSAKQRDAIAAEARAWEEAFARLDANPFVELVQFEARAFLSDDGFRHQDLFGTLARYVPLCQTSASVAAWAGAPPDGRIVFVTDADFLDLSSEHMFLHLIVWYHTEVQRALGGGSSAGAASESAAGRAGRASVTPDAPDVVAVSLDASAAARHLPEAGMPHFIAYCVAAKRRFPAAWLSDVLEDAKRSKPLAIGRYKEDLADPRKFTSHLSWRNVEKQTSNFPFGIDEWLLTMWKLRAQSAAVPYTFFFATIPNMHVINKGVALTASAVAADPSLASDASLRRIYTLAAHLAGDTTHCARVEAAGLAGVPIDPTGKAFASPCYDRLLMREAFPGSFALFFGDMAAVTVRALRAIALVVLDAMAAGKMPHGGEDLEYFLQTTRHHSHSSTFVTPMLFSAGCGSITRLDASVLGDRLVGHLKAVSGCGVPMTHLAGVYNKKTQSPLDPSAVPPPVLLPGYLMPSAPPAASDSVGKEAGSIPLLQSAGAASRLRHDASVDTGGAAAGAGAIQSSGSACGGSVDLLSTERLAAAGWTAHTSRSTGLRYYHSASTGRSVWHDAALPAGWAWERASDAMPKLYVHLLTGEQRSEPPAPAEHDDGAAAEPPASKRGRIGSS
jgi:hypothetical protein